MNRHLEEWLEDKPQIIKDLAREFPPGTRISADGLTHYVVSYFEDGTLGVSRINPTKHYDEAVANSNVLCRDCMDRLQKIGVN